MSGEDVVARTFSGHVPIGSRPDFPSGPDYVQVPGGMRSFAKSAIRSLELLDLFAFEKRPLRAVEIRDALQLHASSADQLLKTMVNAGYLQFDDRKKQYFLTSRLSSFAIWFRYTAISKLPDLINTVHKAFGKSTMISVRQKRDMQVSLFVSEPRKFEFVMPGIRFPLFDSCCGIAALISLDDADIIRDIGEAKLYNRDREISEGKILHEVRYSRRRGYSLRYREETNNNVLAIPLSAEGLPAGSVLSISVPVDISGSEISELYHNIVKFEKDILT
jgi:DNA-binding IclR family transcriptional regulator